MFGQSGSKTSQYAQSQKDKWIDQGTSLNDQLKEVNSYSENQIKYEFEGIIANDETKPLCPVKEAIKENVIEFHTLIVLSFDPETIFLFEGIIASDETDFVCPAKVVIKRKEVEFHNLIVSSIEPDTMFSFERIIANDKTGSVCSVKVAIN